MILRHVPAGTRAGRGAPRSRAMIDGETDAGVPFGWCVLEDADESMEVALLPYLEPPNRAWYYTTSVDADFYDFSHASTVEAVDRSLSPRSQVALRHAFPHVGNVVKRHSDPDTDALLVRGMERAGLFRGVRGWTHPTLRRPDGGVHRRETLVLHPSQYLRDETRVGSPAQPSGSPPSAAKSSPERKKKKTRARVRSPKSPSPTKKSPKKSSPKTKSPPWSRSPPTARVRLFRGRRSRRVSNRRVSNRATARPR